MENTEYKVGQVINYTNGNLSIYTGTIVKVTDRTLVVIDCESGMTLWNAGYAVGSEIAFSQVCQK